MQPTLDQWPPINSFFDQNDYPHNVTLSYENYENCGRLMAHMGDQFARSADFLSFLSKKLLALGVEDFQITEQKTSNAIQTTLHFKTSRDRVTFIASEVPLNEQSPVIYHIPYKNKTIRTIHKKAAEEYTKKHGIVARFAELNSTQIQYIFQNALDAQIFMNACKPDGAIAKRAQALAKEDMKSTLQSDEWDNNSPDAPSEP